MDHFDFYYTNAQIPFNIYLRLEMHVTHSIKISFTQFNVIWRQVYFCWSEFLFFAENFVVERQNNLEFSGKSRKILSLFLGRPLEFAKPPNPRKARNGTIAYAGVQLAVVIETSYINICCTNIGFGSRRAFHSSYINGWESHCLTVSVSFLLKLNLQAEIAFANCSARQKIKRMVVYPAERPHDVSGSRVVFQADILSTDTTFDTHKYRVTKTACK